MPSFGAAPLVEVLSEGQRAAPDSREWSPTDAPLRGIRVLDLTRVIAGPVATRTLALLGADVLRIDPPQLPEPDGSTSTAATASAPRCWICAPPTTARPSTHLLETADVVVTGYRARALERLGLGAARRSIAQRPGIVVAQLTAWGSTGATGDRRGFDSLVQAASGIAWIESRTMAVAPALCPRRRSTTAPATCSPPAW